MNLHANAKTCPNSRELLARRVLIEGWSQQRAARAAGVSTRTVTKWVIRYRAGESMADRSSAPRQIPSRTPRERIEAIGTLRRLRMTAAEIAEILGMALSTVSRWLKRIGLGKRSRLEPPEPPNRYERKRPGELVHVDVKKLGRIQGGAGKRVRGGTHSHYNRTVIDREGVRRNTVGWEFVHVCVDDATRLAYAEVLPDERGQTAAGFLRRAVAWFASLGIEVEAVMSDNGSCYRSGAHATVCAELGLRHLFTRPYRPRTNGKAERFIQTLTDRWAYGAVYGTSAQRTRALPGWLSHYNFRRRHGSLGHRPPGARLRELEQRRG
jgi:transposase InsO family protein